MSDFKAKVTHTIDFLSHDIWSITNDDVRGVYRWLMNIFKAVFLSIRFFTAHRIMERASALTYYTLLALVPIFALILGIGRLVGVQEMIRQSLETNSLGHNEAIHYIFVFADTYLNQANNGVLVGLGIVILLYVIYSLMGNVETVMNEIWQQKKGRRWLRKLTDYLTIIILTPLFLIVSSGALIFLQTYVRSDIYNAELSSVLLYLLRFTPYVFTILMLTVIYIVIPNCKVRFINAFSAAVIAGSLLILFQEIYISGQIWVSKYNAIYGSFAVLPLLLLWVQASWIICLYGAELSYASQNIQYYNFENLEEELSRIDRDFLTLLVTSVVYNRFSRNLSAPTTEELSEELHLPARVTGEMVRQLADLRVISRTSDDDDQKLTRWLPGIDSDKLTVSRLYEILSTSGINRLKINYKERFSHEWETINAMHKSALSKGEDLLLRDISTDIFKLSFENSVQIGKSSNQPIKTTKK